MKQFIFYRTPCLFFIVRSRALCLEEVGQEDRDLEVLQVPQVLLQEAEAEHHKGIGEDEGHRKEGVKTPT